MVSLVQITSENYIYILISESVEKLLLKAKISQILFLCNENQAITSAASSSNRDAYIDLSDLKSNENPFSRHCSI